MALPSAPPGTERTRKYASVPQACARNIWSLLLAAREGKTAISRIENHAEDIKISTLNRVARALGKRIQINLV